MLSLKIVKSLCINCSSQVHYKSLSRSFSSFSTLLAKKDWSGAVSYLEKHDTSEKLDLDNLDFLMGKLYSNNKHLEAYKLLILLPTLGKEPSELDYTLAIEVSLNQNRLSQAMNVLYQSQIYGITLDSETYSALLGACTKDTGARNIKWIISCMYRDQAMISIQTSVSIIKIGMLLKDFGLIENVIKLMHQAKYDFPMKLINSFLLKNDNEMEEYKSLKNVWNGINQNSYSENVNKFKSFETSFKDSDRNSKKSPSFELVLLPKEIQKQFEDIDSEPDETTSSD
ncbi:hypothetical protein SteCoe_17171 [Stentor coeruleus]|uniref:Pentacotripeptide-repeat region of PRORP domain-containing protein n=1 Tax=Stentor coeruleus TaxID=5963 RepID=A0A1R2BZQ3_9CILI|nr:hypothetical protein SteCoe_17171 [Stentor coeruleus]